MRVICSAISLTTTIGYRSCGRTEEEIVVETVRRGNRWETAFRIVESDGYHLPFITYEKEEKLTSRFLCIARLQHRRLVRAIITGHLIPVEETHSIEDFEEVETTVAPDLPETLGELLDAVLGKE